MKPTLRIPNWKEFQHYDPETRDIVWIKNYLRLLKKYEYTILPESARAHLHGLWILAGSYNGKLPFDPDWIAKQISAASPIDWKQLAELEWVALNDAASILLADREQDDSLRALARKEEEQDGDKKKETPSKVRRTRKAATHMTTEWRPTGEVIAQMQAECPSIDAERAIAEFRDYWMSVGEQKSDWNATYRNRIRYLHGNKRHDARTDRNSDGNGTAKRRKPVTWAGRTE